MNAPLWKGSPLESFAGSVFDCPTHRLAYYLGQIEQTVFEVFGVLPDADDIPDEARQVAHLMMRTLSTSFVPDELQNVTAEAASIIDAWQKRVARRAH